MSTVMSIEISTYNHDVYRMREFHLERDQVSASLGFPKRLRGKITWPGIYTRDGGFWTANVGLEEQVGQVLMAIRLQENHVRDEPACYHFCERCMLYLFNTPHVDAWASK